MNFIGSKENLIMDSFSAKISKLEIQQKRTYGGTLGFEVVFTMLL